MARIEIDPEANALLIQSDGFTAPRTLEAAIAESFPGTELVRPGAEGGASQGSHGGGTYEVRIPHPQTLAELRTLVERVRSGMAQMIWKYEPDRSKALAEQLDTFGRRDSLARLPLPEEAPVEAHPQHDLGPIPQESRVVH